MAKDFIFIGGLIWFALGYSSCVSRNEITDTPQSEATSSGLQTVPVSVYDTERVTVQLIKRPNKKVDTIKNIFVVAKTFEELASTVQRIYTSQIGVVERTGHNDGVQVEKYLASVGLGKGNPYCAAGIHWSLMTAGIPNAINAAASSTLNLRNLVYYKRQFIKTPHAADVINFWIPSLNGIHHCGFFDRSHDNGNYESVEFNTSVGNTVQQEGGGVGRKVRSFNGTYSCNRWIKN